MTKEHARRHFKRMTKKDVKEALKEAAFEWMDKQLATVGIWTLKGLAVLFVVALLFASAYLDGWRMK
jgi:hypothetical protein